jgi:hypothetical protein
VPRGRASARGERCRFVLNLGRGIGTDEMRFLQLAIRMLSGEREDSCDEHNQPRYFHAGFGPTSPLCSCSPEEGIGIIPLWGNRSVLGLRSTSPYWAAELLA